MPSWSWSTAFFLVAACALAKRIACAAATGAAVTGAAAMAGCTTACVPLAASRSGWIGLPELYFCNADEAEVSAV